MAFQDLKLSLKSISLFILKEVLGCVCLRFCLKIVLGNRNLFATVGWTE